MNPNVQPIQKYSQSYHFSSSNCFNNNNSRNDYENLSFNENDDNDLAENNNNINQIKNNDNNNLNNKFENQNQENDNLNNNNLLNIQNTQNNQNNLNKKIFKVVYYNNQNNNTISKKTTQEQSIVTNNAIEEDNNQDDDEENINDENNNIIKKKYSYDYRNFPNLILGNFFNDLIIFINELIEIINKNKKTTYSYLNRALSREIYLEYGTKERIDQLDKTALIALDPFNFSDQKKERIQEKIEKNNEQIESNHEILLKIYNEIDIFQNILNKSVKQLLDIYIDIERVRQVEAFYDYFPRFDMCQTFKNKKNEEERQNLMDFAKDYENYLKNKLNDENKVGPKCKLTKICNKKIH